MKSSINKLLQFDEINDEKLSHLCKYLKMQKHSESIDLKKSIFSLVHKKENDSLVMIEDTDVNMLKIRIILICTVIFKNFSIDISANLSLTNYWMSFEGSRILKFVFDQTSGQMNPADFDVSEDVHLVFEKLRFQSLDNLFLLSFQKEIKETLEGMTYEKN